MKVAFITIIALNFLSAQFNANKIFSDLNYLQNRDILIDSSTISLTHVSLGSIEQEQNQYYGLLQFRTNIRLSDSFLIVFNPLIAKNSNYYIAKPASNSFYVYKTYVGLTSYSEEGYIQFKSQNFFFKLGRQIDKIGYSPIEHLYINNRDYHDGYYLKINYNAFTFENRFYQLSPLINDINTNRYFYHHSLKWEINKNWEIGVHESTIQSGIGSAPKINLLNPFSFYHAEQVNDNINLNTIYFFQTKYRVENFYTWLDFLLDDFQSDSEKEGIGNKEPTEFAVQFGLQYFLNDKNTVTTQFTIVRNRTFNDPVSKARKFIDHDKYMGFYLGSNLINLDFAYSYKIESDMYFMYRLKNTIYGNESIFSSFNTDFETHESYSEPIPYGKLVTELDQSISHNSNIYDINYYTEINIKHINKVPYFKLNFGLVYKIEL